MRDEKSKKIVRLMWDSNVRVTPQRVTVLEYLLNSKDHPTASEIYQQVESKLENVSQATIYNNLNTLSENGLIQELAFGNSATRYDGDTSNHYHIICEGCGKIVDFQYPLLTEVEILAEQMKGFKVSHHRFEIYGKCQNCSPHH